MFLMLANVLKRCDLAIVSSAPTSEMTISDDSLSTTDWQEMGIFEKVTVLRALCDARLNRPDIEQTTEVYSHELHSRAFIDVVLSRICQRIHFVLSLSEKIREETNYGISATLVSIAIHGARTTSKCPQLSNQWKLSSHCTVESNFISTCRTSNWECVCRTLEEWNAFIEKFRKTCSRKNSSSRDRQLLERLVALNTELPETYARQERERQRRWNSYEPKRASTRLEAKRQQRIEFEEITQEQKARHDKFLEFRRRQEEVIAKEKERLERQERVKRREGTAESTARCEHARSLCL